MAAPELPSSEYAQLPTELGAQGTGEYEQEYDGNTLHTTPEWLEPGFLPIPDDEPPSQPTTDDTEHLSVASEVEGPLESAFPSIPENIPAVSEQITHIKQARRQPWLETGDIAPVAGGGPKHVNRETDDEKSKHALEELRKVRFQPQEYYTPGQIEKDLQDLNEIVERTQAKSKQRSEEVWQRIENASKRRLHEIVKYRPKKLNKERDEPDSDDRNPGR